MRLNALDWLIVLLYAAVILTVGLYIIRKPKTSEGYFLADRRLKWPFIGASLFASNISAEHFVGLAGGGFAVGMAIGGFEWMAIYCMIPLILLFLPFYIKNKIYTVPEFLERRFSPGVRSLLSGMMVVLTVLTKVSVSLWAAAVVFSVVFGWNELAVIAIVGVMTAIYTMNGGLSAVVYTDAIQTTVLLAAAAVLTVLGLSEVGGLHGLQAKVDPGMLEMVKPLDHPEVPWLGMFLGIFIAGSFYWSMDQVLVQRVFAAKDLGEGRKGAVLCAFLKVLTPFLLVLPGVIAKAMGLDLAHRDDAYPALLMRLMPHGLIGLTVAGLAAALMGHLSSTYNSVATLFTRDFYLKWKPEAGNDKQILVGRLAVAVVAVLGIAWAPAIGRFGSLWDYLQSVSVFLVMPFVGVFFIGVVWRRINVAGVFASVVTGCVIGPILLSDSKLHFLKFMPPGPLDSWMHRAIVEFVICCAVLIAVSLLTPPPPQERLETTTIAWWRGRAEAGTKRAALWRDYGPWLALVVLTTSGLWYIMR